MPPEGSVMMATTLFARHTRLRANILGVIRKRLLAIVRKYAGRNADAQMQVAALAAYKYL